MFLVDPHKDTQTKEYKNQEHTQKRKDTQASKNMW